MRVSNSLDPDQDRHRMSVLIWIQPVCKGYQYTNKFPTSKENVNKFLISCESSGANVLFKYVHCVDKNRILCQSL